MPQTEMATGSLPSIQLPPVAKTGSSPELPTAAWMMNPSHDLLELPGFLPCGRVVIKLEGLNPAGSIKLKTARALILQAEQERGLEPRGAIIESTSGNLGIALAMICAERGYRAILVTDLNGSARSRRIMRALGAEVVVIDERDALGGYLERRLAYVQERVSHEPQLIWLNQYGSEANPAVHAALTAPEIFSNLPAVQWLFVAASTAGTLSGCAQYVGEKKMTTRVVGVDVTGSVVFGGTPGKRRIPGIGASRRSSFYKAGSVQEHVMTTEAMTIAMCREMARRYGFLIGGSTGSVLAAIRQSQALFDPEDTVVAISPDLGESYLETIYDDSWVVEHFGAALIADQPSLSEKVNRGTGS